MASSTSVWRASCTSSGLNSPVSSPPGSSLSGNACVSAFASLVEMAVRRLGLPSGKTMSFTVAFSSVTWSPVMLWTRSEILRRTSSTVCRMSLPYSIPIVRSMAASTVPISVETPRVWLPEPVILLTMLPAAREALPPMWTPSTSCAAMPAIRETTESLMMVLPRSLTSGLSC